MQRIQLIFLLTLSVFISASGPEPTCHLLEAKVTLEQFFRNGGKLSNVPQEDISTIMSKEALKEFVLNVIQDSSLLVEVAARSYRHPLGFLKVTLVEGTQTNNQGLDWSLRIHLWRRGLAVSKEGKHWHRFDMLSRVVTGKLANLVYEKRPMTTEQHAVLKKLRKLKEADFRWLFQTIRTNTSLGSLKLDKTQMIRARALLSSVDIKAENLQDILSILVPHRLIWNEAAGLQSFEELSPVSVKYLRT